MILENLTYRIIEKKENSKPSERLDLILIQFSSSSIPSSPFPLFLCSWFFLHIYFLRCSYSLHLCPSIPFHLSSSPSSSSCFLSLFLFFVLLPPSPSLFYSTFPSSVFTSILHLVFFSSKVLFPPFLFLHSLHLLFICSFSSSVLSPFFFILCSSSDSHLLAHPLFLSFCCSSYFSSSTRFLHSLLPLFMLLFLCCSSSLSLAPFLFLCSSSSFLCPVIFFLCFTSFFCILSSSSSGPLETSRRLVLTTSFFLCLYLCSSVVGGM